MPSHRIALFVLFLVACTSAPRSATYERGTLTAPPPAPVRPGVGLPLPGQPHAPPATVQPGPRPPPVPHTPKTASEPTLWASHRPTVDSDPEILGVKLPLIEGRPDVTPLVEECAGLMNRGLDEAGLRDKASKRSDIDKACLASRLHITCAEAMLKRAAEKTPEYARLTNADFLRAQSLYESALQFFARCYAGNRNDPLFEDAKKAFTKEWTRG